MDDLYETIAAIIQERKDIHKAPFHAMLNEIIDRYKSEDIHSELEALEILCLIRSGDTINSTYYVIND